MAEIFTDAGIDYILGIIPKGGALGTLSLGVFTSQTPTTVPTRTQTLGAGITEPASGTGGYARVTIATGDWGAASTNGNGRRITSAQKSFPETTAAWNPASANGSFIATGTTVGAGTVIYAANFDDGLAANMNAAGLVLRVTPFWQLDG